MRVRLIKRQTIVDYVKTNTQAKEGFDIWMIKLKYANWGKLNDIKNTFNSADLLGNGTNRVIFNIGGNKYRVICSCLVGRSLFHLFVNWIGTHAEYDKLCDKNNQYTIDKY